MQDVAIFWDYENCPPPSNASGYIVSNNIRLMAQTYGSVKSLKAYMEITDQVSSPRALAMRSEFQSSGISLIDCPHNGRKEVADKMIIVDMLAYAIDNPAPSVIVLISGDRDFAYALSILRLRHYQVVLVTLSNAHPSLTSQASVCFDWHSEIICPVQPPSQTSSNLIRLVAEKPTYEDRSSRQLSPQSQSSQSTQDAECFPERTDHGDLLHYLRVVTQPSRRRSDLVSYGASIGQQGKCERLGHFKSTTTSSNDVPSESVQTLASPPVVATVAQPQSNSWSDKAPSFSTPLPEPDEPAPLTLLPSLMQPESPLNSPMGCYAVVEHDAPTSDFSFINPIRPASAPHSLPSQSPLPPLVESLGTERAADEVLQCPAKIVAPSMPPHDSTTSEPQRHPSEEAQSPPERPVPVVEPSDPSNASIVVSEEIQSTDLAHPDIESPELPSRILTDTDSDIASHSSATILVNQPASAAGLQEMTRASKRSLKDSESQVSQTRKSDSQTMVDATPAFSSTQVKTEAVVPPIFKILVDTLKTEKAKGYSRPLRSFVADAMYKKGFTFANTGAANFSQYSAIAEQKGVIELGGLEAHAWISLKPGYEASLIIKPATPIVPPIFKTLIQTLKVQQSKGFPRALRSIVAHTIYRSGFVYKDAGVSKFGQYAALAEKQGIVELGGDKEDEEWITLTPEYRNIPMSLVS
ncbi:hypothetical protein BDN70DRAFT_873423 [Pholiota conissans]|uniref:NYN domain-containing protein n=1 Tax=Pholiota conissans TaxID=109636 RepID=A0A9P5Z9W9_9AGAR|nr:hypothetical protein BDN70DRAFT_873423 [Pholiota conissans]